MTILRFTVATEPKRKERPRVTRRGTYTPKATVDYERQVKLAALDVMRRKGIRMFDFPCVVTVVIRLSPPKSMSKKLRMAMLSGEVGPEFGRVDIDNYLKAILDGMNKSVLSDDRLIVGLTARKIASETVGVDVTVEDYHGWRQRNLEGLGEWPSDPGPSGHPSSPPGSEAVAGVKAAQLGDQEVE